MLHRIAGISLLAGLVVVTPALSQNNEALNVDMARCVEFATDAERLACYQEQVESALAERDSMPPAAPNEATSRPAAPATSAAPASAAQPQRAAAPAAAGDADDETSIFGYSDDKEFTGTITELREQAPDRYIITLDNGQVWQMNRSKRYPLRVGQEVRLVSTRWGPSFRLTAVEHGGFVQVRRAL